VVHHLHVDDDGAVRIGRRLDMGAAAGLTPLAVGAAPAGPVVLGSRPQTPGAPTGTGTAVPSRPDEPDAPYGTGTVVDERPEAVLLDVRTGAISAAGHGLTTAALGEWSVRQHGPDDEADHLSMLTVSRAGADVFTLDGLDGAGVAQLGGDAPAPALAVPGGGGTVLVRPLDRGAEAPPLPDHGTTAVVAVPGAVLATTVDDRGRLVVLRLGDHGWGHHLTVAGTGGVDRVLAVTGAPAVLASGASESTYVEVSVHR
jgi:hypothetical protein